MLHQLCTAGPEEIHPSRVPPISDEMPLLGVQMKQELVQCFNHEATEHVRLSTQLCVLVHENVCVSVLHAVLHHQLPLLCLDLICTCK